MDICRIGLIGAGNVGRRHAQVLGSFPDVHLAGITDVVPQAAAALATSVGFFVISNFGVWLTGNMYPYSLSGLAACYAAALPYFRNDVVSNLLFTTVMFSVPALIEMLRPATAKA